MSKKVTKTDEAQSFDEYGAVTETLKAYIGCGKTGNSQGMREVFHTGARVIGSFMGEYDDMDLESFIDVLEKNGPSPDVQYYIASIDITGLAASARVEIINWYGVRFTDYFTLYKKSDQWKISGKVFEAHSHA